MFKHFCDSVDVDREHACVAGQGDLIHLHSGSAPVQQAVECYNFTKQQLSALHSYPLELVASLQRRRNSDDGSNLNCEPAVKPEVADSSENTANNCVSGSNSPDGNCVVKEEGLRAGGESESQDNGQRDVDKMEDRLSGQEEDKDEAAGARVDGQSSEGDDGHQAKRKRPEYVNMLFLVLISFWV